VQASGLWGEDKRAALAEADVFCLPSDYESFGTAAAEAAGAGVPVVVTSGCGVRDLLQRSSVRTPPPGDIDGIRRAIDEVLSDWATREDSTANALAIRTSLDWRALAVRQVAIYESAIGTASGRDG
jgi:glycosyltransferase involved in cell wall biosynthesis